MGRLGLPAGVIYVTLALVSCSQGPAGGFAPGHDGGATGDDASTPDDGSPGSFGDSQAPHSCGRWLLRSFGPGPDGQLGTSDDVEVGYETLDFDSHGREVDDIVVKDPGADAKWETSDDPPSSMSKLVLSQGGATGYDLGYSAPGNDGKWSDAVATSGEWFSFDGQGSATVGHVLSGAGMDGTWGDADDPFDRWFHWAYGDGKNGSYLLSERQYVDPGPDGVPDTADDPIAILTTRFHDHGTFADGAGPDGQWGDADDHLNGIYTDQFSSKGYMTRTTLYDAAGPDGTWGTSDDVVGADVTLECLGTSSDVLFHNAPGPDGVWMTADDVVASHVVMVGCDDSVCRDTSPPSVGGSTPR